MNKSELVQKVVEAGIVPEEDALKLTKKMLTELLKTNTEEAAAETEEVIEEPVVAEVIEEPVIAEVIEEPVVEVVKTKVEEAKPVAIKKPKQKQTKFKVILKKELPLVRIPTRMYDALVKGINHKNIKELEIIFNTHGEFVVQDIDHVKKRSVVTFVDGKIVLK